MKRTPLLRKTGLKRIGQRGKRLQTGDRAVSASVGEVCAMAGELGVTCGGKMDPHHLLGRDETIRHYGPNILDVCRNHHEYAHQHPEAFKARVDEKWPGRLQDVHNKKWGLA